MSFPENPDFADLPAIQFLMVPCNLSHQTKLTWLEWIVYSCFFSQFKYLLENSDTCGLGIFNLETDNPNPNYNPEDLTTVRFYFPSKKLKAWFPGGHIDRSLLSRTIKALTKKGYIRKHGKTPLGSPIYSIAIFPSEYELKKKKEILKEKPNMKTETERNRPIELAVKRKTMNQSR